MANISIQPGNVQAVNLTDAYAWLMIYTVPLRFVKQHQSEILYPVM